MGPRAGLDGCGKSHHHRDSKSRKKSIYRLSYRGHERNLSINILEATECAYVRSVCCRLRLKRDGTRAETRISSFGETDDSI